MALPKIDLPLFETKLHSIEEPIKYRPFTVKEEKILLMAQESQDAEQVALAMKQIVTNCCVDVDVDKLPMFDIEYMMLQIRGKSVNNKITFTITDPDTEKPVEVELDVDDITLKIPEGHTNEIEVSDDMRLIMRYPRLSEVKKFASIKENEDISGILFDVMISCIDKVVSGDEVTSLEDYEQSEIMDFVDTFPGGTVDALQSFFENVPVLSYAAKYTNADGNEKEILLQGTETFFL